MPRRLISVYLRAGAGAAKLAFNLTARAAKLAEGAIGFDRPAYGTPAAAGGVDEREPAVVPRPAPAPSPTVYDEEPPTPLPQEEERAKAIDDEPELVDELAEPGAEDGAGAAIEVEEPWHGYRAMTADDVIDHIETATAAELVVLELYERAHRDRQTVLTAAEHRHKAITGPASH